MKLKDRLSVTQALFPEKPKKGYFKYNSKTKDSHLLLHRVGNDIGYPQQILFKPRSHSKSKDYQMLNKKKISDSLLTPADTKRVSIEREKYRLDPKKLLVYRKNQMQLKQNTKIHLQKDLNEIEFTEPAEAVPKTTQSGFYRNSYKKPQSELSMSAKMRTKKQFPIMVRKESMSQQLNLSWMNKTQKVRAVSNKTPPKKQINKWKSDFKVKDKEKEEDKLDWSNKRRFKEIIIKLKEYHKIFSGSITQAEVQLNIQNLMVMEEKKMQDEAAREKILMEKIDDFAREKKQDIIWKNYHHIYDLQDLKKVNPRFYDELTKGRRKRYQLLKLDLKRIEQVSPQKGAPYKSMEMSQIAPSIQHQMFTEEQEPLFEDSYINNIEWLEERSARRKQYEAISRFDKLRLFLNSFGKVRLSAQLFGVPLDKVYYSMLYYPEPFSMEGSFLFFKAVASNDVETVKIFIEQFPRILYQIDDLGRSCLILSTQFNFTELSKTLIEEGLNLDIQSIRGATALSNAIRHQNIQIVLMLLQHGASPWSKTHNLLQYNRSPAITKLIKLARKLSLGMKTMKSCHRYSFWQQSKHLLRKQIYD